MSQSSQDFFIPVDELRRIPSRFVVTRRGGISREQLLDDLSLPQELEAAIDIQPAIPGPRLVVACLDDWVWERFLHHATLLGDEYEVRVETPLPSSSPGLVAGGWVDGAATPTLGTASESLTSGNPDGSIAFSPWPSVNPFRSLVGEAQQSPLPDYVDNTAQGGSSTLPAVTPTMASPSSKLLSATCLVKQEEISDEEEDFSGAPEGEEGGPFLRHGSEESPTVNHAYGTGASSSDREMTEEDPAEGDDEGRIADGYEADHSDLGSVFSPKQPQQGMSYQRASVTPSDLGSTSVSSPSTRSPRAAGSDPLTDQGTPQGAGDVSGSPLDPEEDARSIDAPQDPAIEGLINTLSNLALASLEEVEGTQSLQPGQTAAPEEAPQDTPNTSAESEVLLDAMRQTMSETPGADYSKAMTPAAHEGMAFVEVVQE